MKYHLVKKEAGCVSHQRINSEVPDTTYRDIDDMEPEPATRQRRRLNKLRDITKNLQPRPDASASTGRMQFTFYNDHTETHNGQEESTPYQ